MSIIEQNLILKYTHTDSEGKFQFSSVSQHSQSGTQLQISAMGFAKFVLPILSDRTNYNIILKPSNMVLREIVVTGNPRVIQKRGDTTSIALSYFKTPQDRVIEDILKKIPGIEVSDLGRISYKGKPITNFYIDGDNLLDDKYVLGTRTIPSGIVDSLQIFENHQPIRALQKNSLSENVSVNIILNADGRLKLIGQANIGLGTKLNSKEVVNLMSLKKNYKTLNIGKYNSDGYDLAREVTAQNLTDENLALNRKILYPFININTGGVPFVNQNRYLFNNAGLASTNQLFKLGHEIQLKISGHIFEDGQKREFARFTKQNLPNETIINQEVQDQIFNPQLKQLRSDLEINKKEYYFKIASVLNSDKFNDGASVTINGLPIRQELLTTKGEFSNSAQYVRAFDNLTFQISSFISKANVDQNFSVFPSVFNHYSHQTLHTSQFFTNNSFMIKFADRKFSHEYRVSHIYDTKDVNSRLEDDLQGNGIFNRLQWKSTRFIFAPLTSYITEKLRLSVTMPFSYNMVNYKNESETYKKVFKKFSFEPKIILKLNQGLENKINLQYHWRNDYGDADMHYNNNILIDFRTLRAYNSAFLSEANTHTLILSYNFSKSVKLFLLNLVGFYSLKENNAINQLSLINYNEVIRQLQLTNYTRNMQIAANTSQYSFALKATIKSNVSAQYLTTNQIVNGELIPALITSYNYGVGLDKKLTENLNLKYGGNYNISFAKTSGLDYHRQNSRLFSEKMEASFFPYKNLAFTLNGEHLYNKNQSDESNYFFFDASFSWKLAKSKQELTLSAVNLTNVRKYQNNYLSAFTTTNSSYTLLGRFYQINYVFNF